jgi:hypothetical protein
MARSSDRIKQGLSLARTGRLKVGRACPLCPGSSDINLFRYCQCIVYFNAQISDGAFNLGVSEQKLDGPEIFVPDPDTRSQPGNLSIVTGKWLRSREILRFGEAEWSIGDDFSSMELLCS